MVATTEEFLACFHSINGMTIGEKRKNLFLLLNNIGDPQQINFNSIQPKNTLEENLKVEILIHYKKVPELLEVLKSENPIHVNKLLKASSWILEEMLKHVDGESSFVEQTFPYLSFNAKTKIINKFATYLTSTETADRLFVAINDKYGLYLASKLLPCCSKDLILHCLKTSRVQITARQLLFIIKRNLAAAEEFFELLHQYHSPQTIKEKYRIVFKFIARNDLLLFLKLKKVFQPCLRLGWRSTANTILKNKDLVVKNSKQLYTVLHKKQIARSLSDNFNKFYFYMLPSLNELKGNFNFYLDLIPTNQPRLNLLLGAFEKKYNTHLWEQSELVTPGLLELMSVDEREIWMNINGKPSHFNDESWICLMKAEKSIPMLKRKIFLTSDIQERAELIGCLVETCRINNDKNALTGVLKYVVANHKKDSTSVLYCLMNTVKRCFPVGDLLEEHWKYIHEIVQVFIGRNQMPFYYFDWFENYLYFCLLKGLPIKSEMMKMAKKSNLGLHSRNSMKKKECQKQFLMTYGEIIPEIDKNELMEPIYLTFLDAVTKWNKKYPKDKIPLAPYKNVYDLLFIFLNKEKKFTSANIPEIVFEFYICSDFEEDERNKFLDSLFKSEYFCFDMKFFEWLIKYQPLLVVKYIDSILNYVLDMWYTALTPFFWMICRNYHHLEIPQKIIATCLSLLSNKQESDSKKKNSVTALSYLMETENFLNLIAPYYPSESIIDVNAEENQEKYKMQQAITCTLKNVIPPSRAMESVLHFIKGDYLKYVQRSLYSVSHSVAEIKLLHDFFPLLSDRPVSVRKHVIFLGFKVLNKNEVYKILKSMEGEKNSSIRKFLFKASFNYFNKNPTEKRLWEIVKQNVRLVDIKDKEAFDILMDINKVPEIFLVDYIIFTWEFLENHPNTREENFITAKSLLLDSVTAQVIPNIPKIFCLNIIKKYFLRFDQLTEFYEKIISFTVRILIYSVPETDQEEYLKMVFEILNNYIILCDWKKVEVKKVISLVVTDFCDYFSKKLNSNNFILERFLHYWNNLLQPHQAFKEYLSLNLTLIFTNLNSAEIAVKLAELCNNVLGIYGVAVTDMFCASLENHVSNFLNVANQDSTNLKEENRFTLIENIIRCSNSINCLLVVISLLPRDIPKSSSLKQKYMEIMKELENSPDLRVQLSFCVYLENIEIQKMIVPSYRGFRKTRESKRYAFCSINDYSSKYKR